MYIRMTHACTVEAEPEKDVVSLELQLQTVLSTVWVLGIKLESSGRVARAESSFLPPNILLDIECLSSSR